MSDETEFDYDNIEIDDEGYVIGSAYITEIAEGYDVSASVHSYEYELYEYERDGETRMNHVPIVQVTTTDGRIVSEPHARDSEHPEVAIENAKEMALYVADRPKQFIP